MSSYQEPERRCQTSYDDVNKIWSGVRATPIYGPDCSIGKAVLEALQRDPEHICQICHHNGKSYTNKDIASLSIRVAQHFRNLGTHQTELIGIVAGNTDYLAPLVFGAMLCGLTIFPMNPSLDKEIIKSSYAKTMPSMVFTIGSEYQKIKECLNELSLNANIYTLNGHMRNVPEISQFFQKTEKENDFIPEPLQFGNNQIAAVMRSSGTTGLPKAICLTHAGLLNAYKPKYNEGSENAVFLRSSTVHWISGLTLLISCCLQNTTSVISERGFKSSTIQDVLEKYKITIMFSTPFLLIDILALPNIDQIDFSSLRHFQTGGCCIPYTLIEKAKMYMKNAEFRNRYGTTEGCGTFAIGINHPGNYIGQLVPNIDIKIVDEEDRNLGIGEIGEICTRSIFPWPGYYKTPELNASVYRNGWIYSGDLGYIDKEGNLSVLERKKEVIYYMEHQIYPTELELIIAEIAGVEDVCVCGLSNDKVGHLPAAVIQKSKDSKLTADEVYEYVKQRVDDYKILRGGVYFENFIPKTSTGKKLRQKGTVICEAQKMH